MYLYVYFLIEVVKVKPTHFFFCFRNKKEASADEKKSSKQKVS